MTDNGDYTQITKPATGYTLTTLSVSGVNGAYDPATGQGTLETTWDVPGEDPMKATLRQMFTGLAASIPGQVSIDDAAKVLARAVVEKQKQGGYT